MIGPCSLAGINRSSSSSCMKTKKKATRIRTCRHQPGFPADKDLRTQYEWSKTWMKKRARELAPRMDEFLKLCSDTEDDNPQEQNSQGAVFHDNDILPEGCGKGAGEDNAGASAVAVRRTPPTTKKVPGDSEAAEPRRKRRLRRITKIDKILTSVRAGSPAIQLIPGKKPRARRAAERRAGETRKEAEGSVREGRLGSSASNTPGKKPRARGADRRREGAGPRSSLARARAPNQDGVCAVARAVAGDAGAATVNVRRSHIAH